MVPRQHKKVRSAVAFQYSLIIGSTEMFEINIASPISDKRNYGNVIGVV